MNSRRPLSIHRAMVKIELINSYFASFFSKGKLSWLLCGWGMRKLQIRTGKERLTVNSTNLNDFSDCKNIVIFENCCRTGESQKIGEQISFICHKIHLLSLQNRQLKREMTVVFKKYQVGYCTKGTYCLFPRDGPRQMD